MVQQISRRRVNSDIETTLRAVRARILHGQADADGLSGLDEKRVFDRSLSDGIALLVDRTRAYPNEPMLRLAGAALTAARPLLGREIKRRTVSRTANCVLRQAFTVHCYPLWRGDGPDMLVTVARYLAGENERNDALALYDLAGQYRTNDKAIWAEQGSLMHDMRHDARQELFSPAPKAPASAPVRPLTLAPGKKDLKHA